MTLKFTTTDLQASVKARVKIFDKAKNGVNGLYANKTPNAVTFTYRYWNVDKKGHDYAPVGTFHPVEFNVDHARAKARLLATDVKVHGKDVTKAIRQDAMVAHNGTKTFNEIADLFIARQQEPITKNGRTRPRKESWQRDVYSLVRPRAAWGKKQITDVTKHDIDALLQGVKAEHKPEQTRHVLYVLTRLFRWAGASDFITVDPIAFINAESLELGQAHRKTRYLEVEELRAFWHGLDHPDLPCDRRVALAYKLIIATALRPGEVGSAQRDEIGKIERRDGGDGQPAYRIPLGRVKKRRVIVQPLNSLAQEIVAELLADGVKEGPLFRYRYRGVYRGGKRRDGTLTAFELGRALRNRVDRGKKQIGVLEFLGFTAKAGKLFSAFTPHDLRRTATTHLGFAQVSDKDKARILDHAPAQDVANGGASLKVYDVSEQVEQTKRRRATLDTLDGILREIIGPAPKVVRLRAA